MKISSEERNLINKQIDKFMQEYNISQSEKINIEITFLGLYSVGKSKARDEIINIINTI